MITSDKLILIHEAHDDCEYAGTLSKSSTRIEVSIEAAGLPYVLEKVRKIIVAAGHPVDRLVGFYDEGVRSEHSSEDSA
jgi:hypothetical protein